MRISIDEYYPQDGVEVKQNNGALAITLYANIERTPALDGQETITANVVDLTLPLGSVEKADIVANFQYYFQKALAQELEKAKEVAIIPVQELLTDTDYKAHKVVDGVLSAVEYEPWKNLRQHWRDTINAMRSAATIEDLTAITYAKKPEDLNEN